MTDESICLDSPEGAVNTYVVMLACNELHRQKWQYDPTVSSNIYFLIVNILQIKIYLSF